MMKRADSKRVQGNGNSTSAALSHGSSNGTRHRRLASSRSRPTKVGRAAWVLRRLVPFVGLACLGLVAMIMVYSASRLDNGFSYTEGGTLRGAKDHFQVQKPLPMPPPSPVPPPPPPPPPQAQQLEKKGGEGRAAPAAVTLPPPRAPLLPLEGSGRGASDEDEDDKAAKREARERERELHRENTGRAKKSFKRVGNNDKTTPESGIRKGYTQGQWKGGHLGEDIETDIGDSTWSIPAGSPGSNRISAAAADFGKRPTIINADQDGGGGGPDGEMLTGSRAMKWMPGQLIRLAKLQQRQRDEEDEEEDGGVARARMLGEDAALLIICANRPEYLERTLKAVAEYHPGSSRGEDFAIPVVISQDGSSQQVEEVISRFKLLMSGRAHVIHVHHTPPPREKNAYFKLSAHYKWALTQAFDEIDSSVPDGWVPKDKVIILEEDLEIAPDFFEYFSAMAPLLDSDDTLMAVSAWNDNGQAGHVKDNKALFRSDFFPGLGWMLPRRVWKELSRQWPDAYWDDWLREPDRRRGRQFIRPEVCRTYHFGQKAGASGNQFGTLLSSIKLNTDAVPFREMDVSYLEPDAFRNRLGETLREAPIESLASVRDGPPRPSGVVVEYGSERDYESLARKLGIMADMKAGIPRTAYMGVVPVWVGDTKVYLAPRGGSRQMAQS